MLTGTRLGHHAKVPPEPLQPPSKGAAPPHHTHATHGWQRARRLAAPPGYRRELTRPFGLRQVWKDGRKLGISANAGFMSVQSNSGSGGGSLEATPSWSQLSSSPTIPQQHITATAKSKEGILAPRVHGRHGFSLKSVLRRGGWWWWGGSGWFWPCRAAER